MEQSPRDAVGEWREILGRQVPQARQIVQKLLAEKLRSIGVESSSGYSKNRFSPLIGRSIRCQEAEATTKVRIVATIPTGQLCSVTFRPI